MKKKNPVLVAALLIVAAIVLIVGTILVMRNKDNTPPGELVSESPPSPLPNQSSSSTSAPNNITKFPEFASGQSMYETPYDEVDWDAASATTLSTEDVLTQFLPVLDGIINLSAEGIERVSVRSTGGQHNPLRVMLEVVSSDPEMKDAFINMASSSSYNVLGIRPTGQNAYELTIAATTPNMSPLIAEFAASNQVYYVEEWTKFKESGAARYVAGLNMEDIEKTTDIVQLMIIVEDDVPILYHPTSLSLGSKCPQYAFLWGGVDYQGIKDDDLLIANRYGGCEEIDYIRFSHNKQGRIIGDYLLEAMSTIRNNEWKKDTDWNGIATLEVAGNSMGDSRIIEKLVPSYRKIDKEYPGTMQYAASRLMTFEYAFRYFQGTDEETGALSYVVEVSYSTLDPMTDKRTYFVGYHSFRQTPKDTISDTDAMFVNMLVESVLENAAGGDAATMRERMALDTINIRG